MPSSLLSWYSPLNGGSVPFMRVTRYCSEVNWSCHSASVFWIFLGVSVMPVFYHATLKVRDTRTSQTPRPAGIILLRRPSLFAFHSGFISGSSPWVLIRPTRERDGRGPRSIAHIRHAGDRRPDPPHGSPVR